MRVRDVARPGQRARARDNRAELPRIPAGEGHIDGREPSATWIGRKRRSDHDARGGRVDREKRFAVLVRFGTERVRCHVDDHDADGRASATDASDERAERSLQDMTTHTVLSHLFNNSDNHPTPIGELLQASLSPSWPQRGRLIRSTLLPRRPFSVSDSCQSRRNTVASSSQLAHPEQQVFLCGSRSAAPPLTPRRASARAGRGRRYADSHPQLASQAPLPLGRRRPLVCPRRIRTKSGRALRGRGH